MPTLRKETEIRRMIEEIETIYPPGKLVHGDPIGNYNLGVLAGLYCTLGEYPTYSEMQMQEFFEYTFSESELN